MDIENKQWINMLSKSVKSFGKVPTKINIYVSKDTDVELKPKKKVSKWVEHVKNMAEELNINYSKAMKDPRVKEEYKTNPRTESNKYNDLFNKLDEANILNPSMNEKGKKLKDKQNNYSNLFNRLEEANIYNSELSKGQKLKDKMANMLDEKTQNKINKKLEKEQMKADEQVFQNILNSNLGVSFNQERGKKLKDKKKNYTNLLNRIEEANMY